MGANENVDLVKQGYAAFNVGNIEGVLSLFAQDIEWTIPSAEGVPFGGTYKGHGQVAEFFKALSTAEDILEFTQDKFIAQDDKVVVTGRSKARVKSTGRTLETSYVHIFTVSGGRVQKFVEYFDTAAVSNAYRQSAGARA